MEAVFPPSDVSSPGYANPPGGTASASGFYQSSYANLTSTSNNSNPFPLPPTGQSTTTFDDDPPLLEELGINVPHIIAMAKAVMNPFTRFEPNFAEDADMSGPLALCMLLGFLLLLRGKVQFGTIYGQGIVGALSIYAVINLMSARPIDLYSSMSIVGYALLPMVILSALILIPPIKRIKVLAMILGGGTIAWSTFSAAKIFVAVLSMDDQFWLVAYPLALVYTSFALITVF